MGFGVWNLGENGEMGYGGIIWQQDNFEKKMLSNSSQYLGFYLLHVIPLNRILLCFLPNSKNQSRGTGLCPKEY